MPLNDNSVTVTPTQTGTYRVQCAELCGLWHGNMADNTAMIVSQSDFAAWIQQQTALDAPVMKYPAAVQPYVRARPTDLRVVIVPNSQHTKGCRSGRCSPSTTPDAAATDTFAPPERMGPACRRRRRDHRFRRRLGDRQRRDRVLLRRGQLARVRPGDPARIQPQRRRIPRGHGLPQLSDRPPARPADGRPRRTTPTSTAKEAGWPVTSG